MKNRKKYKITGMTCSACSRAVESALSKVQGVENISVNLATHVALVSFEDFDFNEQLISDAVKKAGYGIETSEKEDMLKKKESFYNSDQKKMILAWMFSVPVMIMMMISMFSDLISMNFYYYFSLIMTGLMIVFPARQVFSSALRAIIHFHTNMDVLIALGSGSAFVIGLMNIGHLSHGFVEISGMILAIHLTGRFIERKAKGKTSEAIRKLMELGAKEAVIRVENDFQTISVSDLEIGMVMLIKPGEKVPTDGMVVKGSSYLDESMATGESVPVYKETGHFVIGGTINKSGSLEVEVKKLGQDTFLSRMIQLVEDAQSTKVPIQAFADKITGYFVPSIIALAVISFFVHYFFSVQINELMHQYHLILPWSNHDVTPLQQALFVMISVLVIACPCALGLATPTAIMAGMGKGAQHGILFRNGEAIQTLSSVNTVVFDKTGTLTKGKPELTEIIPLGDVTLERLLEIAWTLEYQSSHPLAVPIGEKADQLSIKPLISIDFQNHSGKGVSALIDGKKYYAGSELFIREQKVDMKSAESITDLKREQGHTVILVADEEKVAGILCLRDEVKTHSLKLIEKLKERKLKTIMLSGDNEKTVKQTGDVLKIEQVIGNVLPEEKSNKVKDLQDKGAMILMAGDGINDAPALKQANVSLAMGNGTDIAMEVSDIVLVSGEPLGILKTLILSEKIFSVIRQNLFWAFFYNLVAIPLALTGLLHPVIAEIAMAISSITVVTNANRLRKVKLNVMEEKLNKIKFTVSDMTCNHCRLRITKVLENLNGVKTVHIDLDNKLVFAEYDEQTIQSAQIKESVMNAGYTIKE